MSNDDKGKKKIEDFIKEKELKKVDAELARIEEERKKISEERLNIAIEKEELGKRSKMLNNTGGEKKEVPSVGILKYLKDNWKLIAPGTYIYLTTLGMFQAWISFSQFNINVFEFSETNDFLLAALRNPMALFYGFTAVFYFFIVVFVSWTYLRLAGKISGKKYKHDRFTEYTRSLPEKLLVRIAVPIGMILPFLIIFIIDLRSESSSAIEGLTLDAERRVKVSLRKGEDSMEEFSENKESMLHLIGTTERYVFLLDSQSKSPIAIPHTNIVKMRFINSDKKLAKANIIAGNYKGALVSIEIALRLSSTTEDKAILLYLNCVAHKLKYGDNILTKILILPYLKKHSYYGRKISQSEKEFNEINKEIFTTTWSFDDLESWLKDADITDDAKKFIQKKTEQFKKHLEE